MSFHRSSSVSAERSAAMPRASSPSSRACVAACPLWVSKPAQREAHDRDAGRIGDDLACGVDRVAEGARRKFGRERAAGVEMRRGLHDVGFDLEDVLEGLVVRLARRRREARLAQELIGVRERDGARAAAGERAEIVASR